MTSPQFPNPNQFLSCMLKDRHKFSRRLTNLKRRVKNNASDESGLTRLIADIQTSKQLADERKASLPQPSFPPQLPISDKWEDIADLISKHQVIVLCGETGSGKSTQLPKICLALGRGVFGRIGHTQPRRLAAKTLASRISSELGRELGQSVGYKVRFNDRISPATHIKLLTDGMLLAEVQQDKFLNEYDTLIIDEAHERSLNIDFILGYLKILLPKRPDLKVIITSATIDPHKFSAHFNEAPIVNVSGRTFPVKLKYQPIELDDDDKGTHERDDALLLGLLKAIKSLDNAGRGDILVFFSGEREIRQAVDFLEAQHLSSTRILPLYARLSPAEQQLIFKPLGQRKIVLSTNVAETSLTVDGIHFVIDTGFARISRYSHKSKIQRLPIEPVSQASANQRKGRCGRIADGICIRLFDEDNFLSRPEFTEPEIQRTNLASVILQMKMLGFGEIEDFPFLDAPESGLIKDGYRVLEEIHAVSSDRKVTSTGRQLSRLSVDPRMAKMLLVASDNGCLTEVKIIASALSVQDPRNRPLDKQKAADDAHKLFRHENSDFLSYVTLWQQAEIQRQQLTKRKFFRWCSQHFLSASRLQEWRDIHYQLSQQLKEMKLKDNDLAAEDDLVHLSLLPGLLSHIGIQTSGKKKEYLGTRNTHFKVFPGSVLFSQQPKWIMSAEIVETSQLYARHVAPIEVEWIEQVAEHLITRQYFEPHWQKSRGQVGGYERVTLFGLTLDAKRKINFGPKRPKEAREIFIRFALTERDFHTRAKFWRHNEKLIRDIEAMEHKTRRKDLLVDDQVLYDFYDKHLPDGIYSTPTLESFLKQKAKKQPRYLFLETSDLMANQHAHENEAFPDHLNLNGMSLPLGYHFEPGHQSDGITLNIPQAVLNQMTEEKAEWLIPGLLRERVIALLRGLPKKLRKSFVPIPDTADKCMGQLEPCDLSLTRLLAQQLKQLTGVYVPEDAWQPTAMPDHLQLNFHLVNENGKILHKSRDLAELKRKFGSQGEQTYHEIKHDTQDKDGITAWDFGELKPSVKMKSGGIVLKGYPALIDQGDCVALRILDSMANARKANLAGLRRLIMLQIPQDMRYLKKHLGSLQTMTLQYSKAAAPPKGLSVMQKLDLSVELMAHIVDVTFIHDQLPISNEAEFKTRLQQQKPSLMGIANEVKERIDKVLTPYQQLRKKLDKANQIHWFASISDMKQQLDRLVFRGFLQYTAHEQITKIPRYIKGIELRLDKLQHAVAKDKQHLSDLEPLYKQWQIMDERNRKNSKEDERIEALRWMFEELRISLFAQELKTAYPISLKRMKKRWQEMGL